MSQFATTTYSMGRLTPESRVTQEIKRVSKKRKQPNLRETRKALEALEAANEGLSLRRLIQADVIKGWRTGFFWGLIVGFASMGALTIVVYVSA